jgi:hypothetical protein
MLAGFLRPGYDYLLERKLPSVLRESQHHPIAADLDRFLAAAAELGFTPRLTAAMASQVTMRVLIQTGRPLGELTETDLVEFATAVGHREMVHGRSFKLELDMPFILEDETFDGVHPRQCFAWADRSVPLHGVNEAQLRRPGRSRLVSARAVLVLTWVVIVRSGRWIGWWAWVSQLGLSFGCGAGHRPRGRSAR